MNHHERIVSIHPTSHGFGFSVFEDTSLLDWGHAHVRPANNERCLEKITELLSWYDPAAVVIEDSSWTASRRGDRIIKLLLDVGRIVRNSSAKLAQIPQSMVLKTFGADTKKTKHQIAKTIVLHYPELEFKLPPPRKIWMSEDERMSIFSAVSLVMTFVHGPAYKQDIL